MKTVGANRSTFSRTNAAGSNGNTTTAPIVTASLTAGNTEVTHQLGMKPDIVRVSDASGRTLATTWDPKAGNLTTIVIVNFAIDQANCKIEFSANTP